MNVFVAFVCGFITLASSSAAGTSRPIVGIVAQELDGFLQEKYPHNHWYIAASYVKAVESSGAQVVPIAVRQPEWYYRKLIRSINGIVLPGGGATVGRGHPYYDTVKTLYKLAKQLNDEGIVFPILGICLGYEFVIVVANNDLSILKKCEVVDEYLSLQFVQPYKNTSFMSTLTAEQYDLLVNKNLTVNWHRKCVFVNDFNAQPLLRDNWLVTAVSTSTNGTQFVASLEHVKYPFFGIQFHPEKIAFEWRKTNEYPHSEEALVANRFFYDRLVHFARKNDQQFEDEVTESESLIYNFAPVYSQKRSGHFTQIYFDTRAPFFPIMSKGASLRSSFVIIGLIAGLQYLATIPRITLA